MKRHSDTYEFLIESVRSEFGVALDIVNTGGGCEVMQGRLETGHWILVMDAEDFLSGIDERLEADAEGDPRGWFVGVYDNDNTEGADEPASHGNGGCVDYVRRREAGFHDLNEVVREVLGRVGTQASVDRGGNRCG